MRLRTSPIAVAPLAALALAVLPLTAAPAQAAAGAAAPALTQLSTDPYTNTAAEHATEVEPDIYAWGTTLVADFQVGRFSGGGADDIGWAASTDGGSSWTHGFLPGITTSQGAGTYQRVSDPTIAYDPKAGVWLAQGLDISAGIDANGVSVNSSTNGTTWADPVSVAKATGSEGFDKDWITCDTTATSPHYGDCYSEWDITSSDDQVVMSTSTDGGKTWSAPKSPADTPLGLGGQPLVSPDGTVIVPFVTNGNAIRSFTSTDGGASWTASVLVSQVTMHTDGGGIRTSALPSAQIDGAGKVYVSWEDCRFRTGCPANDIVYSSAHDGSGWSAVTRVPIDPVTSTVDHFDPGFGVDRSTSGSSAHIGLYYYFYPKTSCTTATCQLEVGYLSSTTAGATWSAPTTLAGPMKLAQVAQAGGAFVGDYISAAFVSGKAYSCFAVGLPSTSSKKYNLAMYTAGGLTVAGGSVTAAD